MKYDKSGFASALDGTRLFWGMRGPRDGGASGQRLEVVLNDGIGCDGFAWKYLQPHLSHTHRVLHWHYRGHGRSGLPNDPARIDVPAHARDVISLLDHHEIERAVLVGHSMGTQVSLEACRLAPDRVEALVLVCGSYGRVTATFHGSDMLKQVLPGIIEAVEKNRGLARALWGRIPAKMAYQLARLSGEVDVQSLREEDFTWYVEHVSTLEPSLFLSMLKLAGEHTAEDLLASIEAPTLVVAAEKDTFTPPALAKHMAEAIPEAELLYLEGASHAAPVERQGVIAERIDRFLAERVIAEPGTARQSAE
ncbi:MAG: alpha/beta hydrolase [Sandaracinaceae bacterium]|jgi:pimeloyl-ACP methyl ester carboxylesterase|nr:alpha/beta hydrolase [Sandaracinaceae bacterium]